MTFLISLEYLHIVLLNTLKATKRFFLFTYKLRVTVTKYKQKKKKVKHRLTFDMAHSSAQTRISSEILSR